ncbi:DUF6701 domain-containing protein, partial [Ideonella sp.]|uniref:DUF6701 domain-containing protein n=1 Tax=Ideonella sp. TaxID=1929293 RepID=UPI003BB7FF0E
RLVVSWNNVYQYGTTTPYTFQVILHENGEFTFQYGNSNVSGSNATIGVQVSNSDYTLYAYKSGYNANGTAIRWFKPSGTPVRLAEYRMDEYSWNGSSAEVRDSTGNGFNGVRVGNSTATSAGGYICRTLDVPANTNSSINAVDTALDVDSAIGSSGSVALWLRTKSAWNNGSAGMLFDASGSTSLPFYLMRNGTGSLRWSLADSAGSSLTATSANFSFAANTWVHVTVTWRLAAGLNQSNLRIYLNGILAASQPGSSTGSVAQNLNSLFIGDTRSSTPPAGGTLNSANALIDEVQVYNYELSAGEILLAMAVSHSCAPPLDHVELVPVSTSGSTCASSTLVLRACGNADCSSLLSSYTGTVLLSSSSGRGDWALPTQSPPSGSLLNETPGDGLATYTFTALDLGQANLHFNHSLAQDVSLSAVDSIQASSARTAGAIAFRDNSFVFAEDLLGKVSGSDVAVAGRPHDMTLSLIKRDPSTGSCGVATDYSGSRALKLWRTDSGGSHTAPSIVSPALSIPASQPASNNLTLSFSNGVASFNLGSTDQGRYALNARDDSSVYAASAVTGSSNTITVRPFVVMVLFIKYGATANPNGSAATDAVLGPAGANFGATVAAYTWNAAMLTNGADPNNTGTPAANATEAAMKAGNRVNSFASTVNLTPLPGSQTPTSGVLGSLNNGSVPASAFSAGAGATTTLQYTEVGSFALKTTGVVSNFLGSGLALDAVVVNNAGLQNTRVGRFVPAGFVLSQGSAVLRSSAACTPASTFSYLGEPLQLGFTLTAVNALGATTTNYTGSYAKLGLSTAGNWNLAGIAGSTLFATSTSPARLSLGSSSGSWLNGVASGVSLSATPLRASAADGPFSTVWGIAPVDSDGVAMRSLDLDTSVPANSADRTQVATTALRLGRLRLQNAIGSQQRSLGLGVQAQYWNGSAWTDNTLDSCTRIPASSVNFGNLRKGLTTADSSVGSGTLTLSAGVGQLTLAAPGGGRSGTLDVALSLGSTATDASCLQPWTPGSGDAASAGANLAHLRGAWCGSSMDKDPSARASFGLFRGAEHLLHLRENY